MTAPLLSNKARGPSRKRPGGAGGDEWFVPAFIGLLRPSQVVRSGFCASTVGFLSVFWGGPEFRSIVPQSVVGGNLHVRVCNDTWHPAFLCHEQLGEGVGLQTVRGTLPRGWH